MNYTINAINIMIQIIEKFTGAVARGEIEVYNEISLQHELGIFLRSQIPNQKVHFERNVSFFFPTRNFVKREIDISVFSADRSNLSYAIELKFPRNGQYPEQMFSFCRDILFCEQMKRAGFKRTFLIIFADDPLFFSGNGKGIYGYFRQNKQLTGVVRKPTGIQDEIVTLEGNYFCQWKDILGNLKNAVIEANNGPENCSD